MFIWKKTSRKIEIKYLFHFKEYVHLLKMFLTRNSSINEKKKKSKLIRDMNVNL